MVAVYHSNSIIWFDTVHMLYYLPCRKKTKKIDTYIYPNIIIMFVVYKKMTNDKFYLASFDSMFWAYTSHNSAGNIKSASHPDTKTIGIIPTGLPIPYPISLIFVFVLTFFSLHLIPHLIKN